MTNIPIMVRIVDEVIPDAQMERELSNKVITSCFDCGGIYFYQVVEFKYENTEHATDTCIYCAQCGQMQGGIINDPFEELPDPRSVSVNDIHGLRKIARNE